jgi:hypothetical protein
MEKMSPFFSTVERIEADDEGFLIVLIKVGHID